MAIEIVDFPIKHGDFPLLFVCSPEGIGRFRDLGLDGQVLHPGAANLTLVPELFRQARFNVGEDRDGPRRMTRK